MSKLPEDVKIRYMRSTNSYIWLVVIALAAFIMGMFHS